MKRIIATLYTKMYQNDDVSNDQKTIAVSLLHLPILIVLGVIVAEFLSR